MPFYLLHYFRVNSKWKIENRGSIHHLPFTIYRKSKGFTLIELLIVITIIAILAIIAATVNANFQKSARDAVRKRDIHDIQVAMQMYYDNKDHYPVQTNNGIREGFIFGCENYQDYNNWIKIYPGTPWTCTDTPDQNPVTYMKLYPKDPISWKPPMGFPSYLNYVYIPVQNYSDTAGFCESQLTCQGFRLYACLEKTNDKEAVEQGGVPGGVIEQTVSCPSDRIPYLVGPK